MKNITGKMDLILDKIFKPVDINVEIIESILNKKPKSFGKIGSVESSYINHYLDGYDFKYISRLLQPYFPHQKLIVYHLLSMYAYPARSLFVEGLRLLHLN